jgi:folate-dependent phosphoribosylglycinamide formyltransferase PurN
MQKLNWSCFISQSGLEVYNISKELGIMPKLLITNNKNKMNPEVLEYFKKYNCEIREIPFNPLLAHFSQQDILNSDLITLHGFLRIIPKDFIDKFKGSIYNGHPALISKYPELKGLNKQEDVYYNKDKYELIGSVVHKVTHILDDGEIVTESDRINDVESLDDAYNKLRETSLTSWILFFKTVESNVNYYYI